MIVKKIFKATSSLILVSQLSASLSFSNQDGCVVGTEVAKTGGLLENSKTKDLTKEKPKIDEIKRSEKSESSKNEKSQSSFDEGFFYLFYCFGLILGTLIFYYFSPKREQRPIDVFHGNAPIYGNINS